MPSQVCALPGCSNILRIGQVPYRLGGYPGEYCGKNCCSTAYDLMKRGKKFAKTSTSVKENLSKENGEVPHAEAEDFGGVGIIRRYCDRCNKPITLCWKGRSGEYCSNNCLKEAEKEDTMTTEETNNTTAEDSPVSAGRSSTKKATKKAAKKATAKAAPATKKAIAKKAAPSASSNGTVRTRFSKDAVITVKKTDHGFKGLRGEAFDCLKDGMTVEKLRATLAKKGGRMDTYAGFVLKTGIENKLITVK